MSRCSTLIHYDADDDVTGVDDVIGKYRLQCIVLRSVHAQNGSVENIGLTICCSLSLSLSLSVVFLDLSHENLSHALVCDKDHWHFFR